MSDLVAVLVVSVAPLVGMILSMPWVKKSKKKDLARVRVHR